MSTLALEGKELEFTASEITQSFINELARDIESDDQRRLLVQALVTALGDKIPVDLLDTEDPRLLWGLGERDRAYVVSDQTFQKIKHLFADFNAELRFPDTGAGEARRILEALSPRHGETLFASVKGESVCVRSETEHMYMRPDKFRTFVRFWAKWGYKVKVG
jgi:hypothetical protein